ncbi:MAG: hypothetical protein LDL41_21550, partial [Coleofasciculus sp. S288]|nr:hypothetical protein [Coleofasciculus sp. S288]
MARTRMPQNIPDLQTLDAEQQTLNSGLQVAVDVGNRVIKYCTANGTVKALPSWHKDLEEWDTPIPDKNSVVLRYLQGDNSELIGQSWA